MMYFQVHYGITVTFLMKSVGDIIDSNCEFLDSNCLEQKYSVKQPNFLETYRLKWLIRKYISVQNIKLPVHFERTQIPRCILYALSNKEKAKGFYKILIEKPRDLHVHLNEKWKNELNCKIEKQSWTKIFTICFKVINDKNLI